MYGVRCTILEGRFQIADLREGTQIGLMIKISTVHDHHDHLRSLSFNLKSEIANLQSYISLYICLNVYFSHCYR
jgi:hypothetical protein